MFTALSLEIKEISSRLKKFVAIGPIVYLKNVRTPLVRFANMFFYPNYHVVNEWLDYLPNQFLPYNWFFGIVAPNLCWVIPSFCNSVIENVASELRGLDDSEVYTSVIGRAPAGTSMKNVAHYEQNIVNKSF